MPKPISARKKHSVRGSKSGRPIMTLLDLLGRRWTLRILWELRERSLTSRALRSACDEASPTVLQARLSELRQAGLVELLPGYGYRLTAIGKELLENFLPLHRFAARWSKGIVSTDATATLGVAVPPHVKGRPPGRGSATKLGHA
jgi:DNA-binding HxlR family transcriptional regulator